MIEFSRKTGNGGIIRETVSLAVAPIGIVEFERPRLYHLGARCWHVDFRFVHPANPDRVYHGTLWNDGETEISTMGHKGMRRLPATNFPEWRAAIRNAGAPVIRVAEQERAALIDVSDSDNAERVAMGRAAQVATPTPTPATRDESERAAIAAYPYADQYAERAAFVRGWHGARHNDA